MMMSWLHYLLEANLYLAVAYGCYWLLFRKQTFYTANRIYLLAITVLCFVIPLVQFNRPEAQAAPVKQGKNAVIVNYAEMMATSTPTQESFLTANKALQALYLTVSVSMFVYLAIKLYSLLKLVFRNKRQPRKNHTLVYVDDEHTPFSFFGYLFVDKSGDMNEVMLRHEMVHIRQKHSWDIMFTEVLKIINWFNPVVYLLQNSLKALHEFEADRCAVTNKYNQDNYVDFLIAQAYHSSGVPFAHQFSNKQLLKSRIMKLYQKRSGRLVRLNYLVALPLCAGLLCASTMAFSKDYGWIKIGLNELKNSSVPVDSVARKLRLKVTSNGMTGITEKLEIKGYPGKKMIYTAQTLTALDRKHLMQNFGIGVETTTASATTTSLVFPTPPPPPVKPSSIKSHDIPPPPPPSALKSVYKGSKLPPPPPPPSALKPSKTIGVAPFPPPVVNPVKFPEPRVYNESGKVKQISQKGSGINPDTVKQLSGAKTKFSINYEKFSNLTQHLASHFTYPPIAIANKTAGFSMVAFKINNDRTLGNVHVTESLSAETDKELIKCFLSYKKMVNTTPGDYTMGFVLAIEGPVVKDAAGQIKSWGGLNLGTKKRTGREPKPNTLTIMLRGKEAQTRTSRIQSSTPVKVAVTAAQKSFIELETIRFKNIANFIKPKSAGC